MCGMHFEKLPTKVRETLIIDKIGHLLIYSFFPEFSYK